MAWLAGSHWEPCMRQALPGAARCGQGQALGLLEGTVLAGLCGERGPARSGPALRPPLQSLEGQGLGLLRGTKCAPGAAQGTGPHLCTACSWLVSTFRISATQAALISGVGACAPEQTRGVRPHDAAPCAFCRCPGPGGPSWQRCTGVQEGAPGAGHADRRARTPKALALTQQEPQEWAA